MNLYREESAANPAPASAVNSVAPFETHTAPSTSNSNPPIAPAGTAAQTLREGWKRLTTGLHRRGARLYRITQRSGGVYWLAEAVERGRVLSRCFASELHARAWLTDLFQPYHAHLGLDSEEVTERFRLPTLSRLN